MSTFQEDLIVSPYELEWIEKLHINQEVNQHATMYLYGVLKEAEKDNPVNRTMQDDQIEVRSSNPDVGVLFRGLVENIQVRHIRGIYYLEIEAVSHTMQMDLKRKRASFQDKEISMGDLVSKTTKSYPGADVIDTASKGAALERFTMQYEETDWEFIRRLASRFDAGLVPYIKQGRLQYFFGTPEGRNRGELRQYDYTVTKNITDYLRNKSNSNPKLMDVDGLRYEMEAREFFEIGDRVSFEGKTLFVRRIKTELVKAEVRNIYTLATRNGCGQPKTYNEKIIGLSIQGEVIAVERDNVKLKLCMDKKQDVQTAWSFPYATMYAAGGSGGFYFMPEIGDTVFAYFPTREESEGVGFQSIRTREDKGDKPWDPAVKYIRTRQGKELKLAPEEILLTGLDGQIYIKLNDRTGIEIQSSEPVVIHTGEDLSIEAGRSIYLNAQEEIDMKCRTSRVKLDGSVTIRGKEIKNN